MNNWSTNVLYTGGTFDLFHSGHVNFLKSCKRISPVVVVSLNTDEFVEKFKKKRPIMSLKERTEVLESCIYVDKVVINVGGEDSKQAIEMVKPDIIAVGSDWCKKDYYSQMGFTKQWLQNRNIVLVYIPYTDDVSTTSIKERIKENKK